MRPVEANSVFSHQVQAGLTKVQQIKNIIAVASGKGGVGKSTVAANLTAAWHQQGRKVGILDADIYGPSQPQIFGTYEKPEIIDKRMRPVSRYGIPTMSIGYLVDINTPMIWRGPMVSQALQQLLNDTDWGELDYLVIDLPPGTGDIQLTLCQKIPLAGALIVTTPQDLSLIDARRAITMFKKVNVALLGLVENMSLYHCPQCGYTDAIFGEGAGEFIAEQDSIELLARLPLIKMIRDDVDQGCPTVLAHPESAVAELYQDMAIKLEKNLAGQPRNYAARFPKIVVEK